MPFFKKDGDQLLEGPNVEGPGYSLCEVARDEYTYPVDGWYWFPDAATAETELMP